MGYLTQCDGRHSNVIRGQNPPAQWPHEYFYGYMAMGNLIVTTSERTRDSTFHGSLIHDGALRILCPEARTTPSNRAIAEVFVRRLDVFPPPSTKITYHAQTTRTCESRPPQKQQPQAQFNYLRQKKVQTHSTTELASRRPMYKIRRPGTGKALYAIICGHGYVWPRLCVATVMCGHGNQALAAVVRSCVTDASFRIGPVSIHAETLRRGICIGTIIFQI